jgi:hypothetical protein
MTDEPTAWEEINPVTVSAQRRGPPFKCSVPDEDRITFRNELTACLTLTAPAGMTEENRRDWLAVAWDSLKHIPADILTFGARKARLKCDHPSKIVPAIIAETAEMMGRRSRMAEWSQPQLPAPKPDYCTPEEAAEILRSVGIKPRYSPGSKPIGRDPEEGLGASAREPD